MTEAARILEDALVGAGRGLVLVVTGAGVSVASGIPTFRGNDPGAIWTKDVTELGTHRYFRSDPVGSWQWYLSRFDQVLGARPNPAHFALAAVETWHQARGGDFLLVSQNIDTLHEAAGSRQLVKVHGTADRVRCARVGCKLGAPFGSLPRAEVDMAAFLARPGRETLPRCPNCGEMLRQHVLWFDEYYTDHADYQFARVEQALERMALALFAGTSFSVGLTERVLQAGLAWKVPMISIDPSSTLRVKGLTTLAARAEEVLPELCRRLGVPLPTPGGT